LKPMDAIGRIPESVEPPASGQTNGSSRPVSKAGRRSMRRGVGGDRGRAGDAGCCARVEAFEEARRGYSMEIEKVSADGK